MKPIRIAALSLCLLLARTGWAEQPVAPVAAPAAPEASVKADEEAVHDLVAKRIPGKVGAVRKMPFGMYEVVIAAPSCT